MDLTSMLAFYTRHQWTILFYAAMIGLVIIFRKRFEWHGIVGLYKTKVGLKLMERWGTKYKGLVQLLGYIGIGVGFIGMALILGQLLFSLWQLIFKPAAPAAVGLALPGISLPGQVFTIPLITGWIALFLVIIIHEFSHGVVSRAHGIPVKSSGLLAFGPIGGAFVEPEEKKLVKQDAAVQHALFAAGPFSNIITGIIALLLVALFMFTLAAITVPAGVEITQVTENGPAANASIAEGMVITAINGVPVDTTEKLSAEFDKVRPGEAANLVVDGKEISVLTTAHPTDAESTKGYVGIFMRNYRGPEEPGIFGEATKRVVEWLVEFFQVFFMLSLGIGLANLLPLGPVDGGRMFQLAARQIVGNDKKADRIWVKVSWITLGVLLVLIATPIVKALV